MSWLLYPKNPTEEYRQALKELGREDWEDTALSFSNSYFGLLADFFCNSGIHFTGYESGSGALVTDLSEELCRKMADFLEENRPFAAEQLPEKWRERAEHNAERLMELIPIFRCSAGICGSN